MTENLFTNTSIYRAFTPQKFPSDKLLYQKKEQLKIGILHKRTSKSILLIEHLLCVCLCVFVSVTKTDGQTDGA